VEHLWQDIRYGVRQLLNQRAFTLVAVLTLALGIGANVAIFNTLDALFFKKLPVQRPDELVSVLSEPRNSGFSNPLWEQLRDRQNVFVGIFAWTTPTFNLAQGGEVRNASGLYASGEFFTTLGIRSYRGRLLTREDDRRGGEVQVAVLSYDFWQRELGGAEDAVGSQIRLDGNAFQIVGVTPPGFFGLNVGGRFDVAVPLAAEPVFRGENSAMNKVTTWWLRVGARLPPGMTQAQADAHLQTISKDSFAATVSPHAGARRAEYLERQFSTTPGSRGLSGLRSRYQNALWVLMGIVTLVLLIACANIANLLLARATVRQKEMGVRLALGASRHRLIQQLLTESLLLAAAGTLLAVPLASAGSHLLVQQISTSTSKWFLDLAPDWRAIAFVAAVALITTVLFGLAPAFNATRVSLADAMKQTGPGPSERRGRFGLGRMIVVVQVAISMVLVAGAGLLLHTFYKLTSLDRGFEAQRVLLVLLDTRRTQASGEGRDALYLQFLERTRGIPGVSVASLSDITPISGSSWNGDVEVPGYVAKSQADSISFFNSVAPEYFRALGTPLVAGRDFTANDGKAGLRTAIVNEAFAAKFFPGHNPVGQQFFQQEPGAPRLVTEIVGLVRNSKYQSLREEPLPTTYLPYAQQNPSTAANLLVRTPLEPGALIPLLRSAFQQLSPATALRFIPLETQIADSIRQDRLLALLSGLFGGLALLLSAIGLYGLLAHSVARRRREIGIRMALGSTPQRILQLILGDGVRLALAGVALGVIAALWATRVLAKFLYGVKADDPAMLGAAGALLVIVATVACSVAARRAAHIEPWAAIRHE